METKINLCDFTNYSLSDLKDSIKWHKAQLKFWTRSLGDAIYSGFDSSISSERVCYHAACISKATSYIHILKRTGLLRVN